MAVTSCSTRSSAIYMLLVSAVLLRSGRVDAATMAQMQDCDEEQLNRAKLRFKDCMEDKKAYLVQLDYEETDDIQLLICSGLKELATGCKAAVKEFSVCMGREHVDHLVDIHLTSISDVLAPFHPSLRLRDCPVFNKPPPIIHKKPEPEAAAAAEPEYEPITGGSSYLVTSLPLLATTFASLMLLRQ